MNNGRMEAFSDGVLAIIITIMVLELSPPEVASLSALRPLIPKFLSYVLSFLYVGIYWNNHHHLFQVVERVSGGVLWANLHLLFWLSLFPFVTAWIGESGFLAWPLALYGLVLLMAAVAYYILTRALLAVHGPDSGLAKALGRDIKGRGSILLYAVSISLAFFIPWATGLLYWLAAMIWLIPDRRMEAVLPG
ncbi:MAG TPA: TMEM175 family protein [Promineifilum sp.]